MLRVIVNPRPFPVHRTIRFFNAENEYLRAVLPAPPSGGGQQTSVQVRFLVLFSATRINDSECVATCADVWRP